MADGNSSDDKSKHVAEPFKYIKDQPISSKDDDKFAYGPYVEVLKDIVVNSDGPLNVGLFGPWGAGKSSILYLLQQTLKNEKEVELIIIDAWRLAPQHLREEFLIEINNAFNVYDKEKFLRDLVSSKEEEQLEEHKESWKNVVKKLIPSIVLFSVTAGLILLDRIQTETPESNPFPIPNAISLTFIVGFVLAILPNLKPIIEEFRSLRTTLAGGTRTTFPRVELSHQFQNIFSDLLSKILDEKKSLVVAIDNLDRCESEVVIEMLSMIKTFMGNLEKCKFIISCDNLAIESHLANTRAFNPGDPVVTPREFLRKFFQVTMRVPPFIPGDLTEYADALLTRTPLRAETGISEILNLGVLKNPRKIHQYINDLVLLYNIAKIKEQDGTIPPDTITSNTRFLTKIIILREEYPEFYRFIERDSSLLEDVDRFLRGNLKADSLPSPLQGLLRDDPFFNYFLRITLNVTSRDILAFVNLKQEKFESDLPDRDIFIERIISNDTEYLAHRLNKQNSLSGKYFLHLIQYMKRSIYSSKSFYATQCINLLIENIDNAPDTSRQNIINNLERFLQLENILESIEQFDVEKVFRLLKSFNYDGRNVILDKYAKILARPDFLNEGLLRKFVENQDLVSDATVDRINESIASWMTTKTDYNVFLQILSLNSVTKKKFIKSQILQSVVSKIIPNNPTSAQSDTTVYLQYKDLSTPTVKSSFLDKMNNLLKTSESDDFLINRYNRPLNEFQGIAVSTLLQLAPEDIETGISNWIYDTVDTIKSNVDSIFTNRSPKPGNDFHIELIRVKLVLFNKLESTKQKATVTELKDLMEKTQRYQELIGYVKMHKSSILEYDEIFDSIMQSINLNPSDSSSFDFLIKYSSVERKEKIVQILKDWIPSRDPGELEGLLLSLKNNHAMIPNQGKAVLKEALKVVMDSPSSSGNLLLGEVIGML